MVTLRPFSATKKKTSKVWLKSHISVFDFFSFFFEKWIGPTTIWNSFENNWNNMVWVCELVCTTHVHNKCRQCGYRPSVFFHQQNRSFFCGLQNPRKQKKRKPNEFFLTNYLRTGCCSFVVVGVVNHHRIFSLLVGNY